jgi:hypothetical protein
MPRLVYSSEKHGQGATIELDSKEVVVCSIAQTGVLVFLYDNSGLVRSIISNFWGARLYKQSDVYKNAQTAQALNLLYPDIAEPLRHFKNPVLTVFANAIWHCGSAAEVCSVLNEAAAKLPQLEQDIDASQLLTTFRAAQSQPPKRPPEMKPLTVASVMETYRTLLMDYPVAILDTAMLPITKTQMKVLLKSLYAEVATAELQNYIEQGYMFLSQFQDGVGPVPIDGGIKFSGAMATKAELAQLDKWVAWQQVLLAEMDLLAAEWKRFKEGEPV